MTADGSASLNLKTSFHSGPIRWLVGGGASLIAAIAVGTTIMVGNFRERALSSNERELENTVLLLAHHFDQQLEDFTVILKDLAAQIHSDGITPDIFKGQLATLEWHEVLRTKVGAYSDISGINVFDADGMLINSSEAWPVPDIGIADRAYFKTFKSGVAATPIVVELVRSRFVGSWATVVAHQVIGPKGEFLGAITRAISPATFERYFASVALGEGAAISMYHRDGTLLARYPHIERMIGSHVRASPIYRPISSNSGHGTVRSTSPIDGHERIASAYALKNFPIAIVASTTVAAALADWREQTRFLIAVAGLLVLVITTMLFLVIRKLSQQHRVEKQRLDTAINNMTQGLLLFDSSQRLVVCNQRYLEMYGLSAQILKPGCTFREVIAHRKATGSFEGDLDEYCSRVMRDIGHRNSMVFAPRTDVQFRSSTNRWRMADGWRPTRTSPSAGAPRNRSDISPIMMR